MVIRGARVYTRDFTFEEREIWIKDRRIAEDGVFPDGEDTVLDASGLFAIPGLVDLHLHGAAGYDFCTADEEGLQAIVDYEARNGVMALCPATMTLPAGELEQIALRIANFREEQLEGADVVGIRLEGPFLNERKAGAQKAEYLRIPDAQLVESIQSSCDGLVKIVDLAPELPGALAFIRALRGKVMVSVAHTDADYETALQAFVEGADHMTHLYNAMNGMHHRTPGPIVAGMESEATAEIIADGVHVHPAMVRLAFRNFGAERMILISDSMEATGLEDGTYALGGQSVTVQGSVATLTDNPATIAGSVTNLFDCMRCAVLQMHIPLEDAVRAASTNPARLLGIQKDYGHLEPGALANLCLVDENLNPVMVLREGEIIRREEWNGTSQE